MRKCRFCNKNLPEHRRFFCEPYVIDWAKFDLKEVPMTCQEKFIETYNDVEVDRTLRAEAYYRAV